mmetsp:Transcript_38272/g.42323  ORF Transcript_38272/g.42323 Transcript_38272/m.42323 type:complete len:466 (+) Transcript_38272:61-1458(+)
MTSTAITKKCGLTEIIVFLIALLTGSACSICSKVMMDMYGIGYSGEVEKFSKPIFQTFGMFVGMTFGILMHYVVLTCRIPFPGYEQYNTKTNDNDNDKRDPTEKDSLLGNNKQQSNDTTKIPLSMYFLLAIPSVFDLGATALCMLGLRYLDVSVYQLLRGSGLIFVAVLKDKFLKDKLYKFQWFGVFGNLLAVSLIGLTAVMTSTSKYDDNSDVVWGISLVLLGSFVQSLQYVFEEKVMTMDIPAPPLLLIGMEGVWGALFCLTIVYPIAYFLPGDDYNGSYEHFGNTMAMIRNTPSIQLMFGVYFVAIFSYNLFAVLVTYLLNSIWHAILDNFRPITIWLVDLFICYNVDSNFGEEWTNPYSWFQLMGMAVLLYGTAVYNAPHPGSIWLQGEWYSFGLNYKEDYEEIQETLCTDNAADDDDHDDDDNIVWESKLLNFRERTNSSSFIGSRRPFLYSKKTNTDTN